MSDLTITHETAEGTLVDGTSRGDGSAEVLRRFRFRWGRSIGCWYLPHSRDKAPMRSVIEEAAAALRAAGFSVSVEIGDTAPRDIGVVEGERAERAEGRAEYFAERAAKHDAKAEAAYARSTQLSARFAGGQPILVDHHSAPKAIRDRDRALRAMHKAREESESAERDRVRSSAAAAHSGARHNPVTVGNRIAAMAAEVRKMERTYGADVGGRRGEELQHLRAQLDHWRTVRAEQLASGEAVDVGRHNVKPGDLIRIGHSWTRVVRANAASVTVETGYSWTDRYPWHQVTGHRPQGQDAAEEQQR